MEDEDNIFDILKNPARICEMDIDLTYFLLEKCASLLEESFPALEYLRWDHRLLQVVQGEHLSFLIIFWAIPHRDYVLSAYKT